MFKRNGGYYLMFGAGGTEFRTYATGVARSDSPLGDFTVQTNNPVFFSPKGVVTGTAHGAVVKDERGEWWYFYGVHGGCHHQFERYVGMDRITFLPNGDAAAASATNEPQWLPGYGTGTAWKQLEGSYLYGGAAFDRNLETEFVPNRGLPYQLSYHFNSPVKVCANRLIWSDGGSDVLKGVESGPIKYRLQLKRSDASWITVIDASANDRDLTVDYREIDPAAATDAKLEVLGAPSGILPRVVEWTLFGEE